MDTKRINCFLPYDGSAAILEVVSDLRRFPVVKNIYLLTLSTETSSVENCLFLPVSGWGKSETWQKIREYADTEYTLIHTTCNPFFMGMYALERMLAVTEASQSPLIYSDYTMQSDEKKVNIPLIDTQFWAVRDEFDFGSLRLFRSSALIDTIEGMPSDLLYSALYYLTLNITLDTPAFHLPEFLYTEVRKRENGTGKNIFDYVNPSNREVQLEMERSFTDCLKRKGAWLKPVLKKINLSSEEFDCEASVIIPVRNREQTIKEAIQSALSQKTDFKYNVIVIDNHSTDQTTEIVNALTNDRRLIHLCPAREDLGIGGCWNYGVADPKCGKFAIQLDSDDIYKDEFTLQKIVDAFYKEQCAMLVGTYQMTDFDLNEISPGIIDHREWTEENGHNNLLRVNGLGAPRAFYTPVLRELKLPDTSYGEDYAIGLRISREYRIGRIYEPLYCCRRWENNSDASLDISTANRYNYYKDMLRQLEIKARIGLNKK